MRAELFFQRRQLRGRRQRAVEQQVNDFLEARIRGEVVDVVSTVR
jgi:hypothetical protein